MAKTETKPIEWVVMGGAGKLAPENTMSALNEGRVRGVDHVWLDLQVSRDGVPFLFRDKRLELTSLLPALAKACQQMPIA